MFQRSMLEKYCKDFQTSSYAKNDSFLISKYLRIWLSYGEKMTKDFMLDFTGMDAFIGVSVGEYVQWFNSLLTLPRRRIFLRSVT